MKNSLLYIIVLFVFFMHSCSENGETAPEHIISAFIEKYPEATDVEWEKENEEFWEAEFVLNEVDCEVLYDNDGTLVEIEYVIDKDMIPVNIATSLKNNYAVYEIEEVQLVENDLGRFYKVELEYENEALEVVFSEDGNVEDEEIEIEED